MPGDWESFGRRSESFVDSNLHTVGEVFLLVGLYFYHPTCRS